MTEVVVAKMIPYGMTFDAALRSGHVGRMERRAYLDWIKSFPCCVCQRFPVDPSHLNGHGFGGIGTKTPDWWAIPLCREHHSELERDQARFEELYKPQTYWALMFLTRAIYEGVLKLEA